MKNNYQYVAEYAVMIITDETEESAYKTLEQYVKTPSEFKIVSIEPI